MKALAKVALALALCVTAPPSFAQSMQDATPIINCLDEGRSEAHCAGAGARACLLAEGSFSDQATLSCYRSEALWWQGRRMEVLMMLRSSLPPDRQSDLEALLSATAVYAEALCQFEAGSWENASDAEIARAHCHMAALARQYGALSLYLGGE